MLAPQCEVVIFFKNTKGFDSATEVKDKLMKRIEQRVMLTRISVFADLPSQQNAAQRPIISTFAKNNAL
jgi:hypothetical protein